MAPANSGFGKLRTPTKVAELGIPHGLAEDLFMRRLLTERSLTLAQISEALNVAHSIGKELAESLRDKSCLEYLGSDGRDYRVSLTEFGAKLTNERMQGGRHAASIPVTLNDYRAITRLQQIDVEVDRELVRSAFRDLVIEDAVLDQIGPAFSSGGAMFIYGPAGTGKTSIAERLGRFYSEPVLIPYFVEIDRQLISVYDPSIHEAVAEQPENLDKRYVLCRRPSVIVGGELTLDMLDLKYDSLSGINAAPVQMLANNGILIIDDFGRQSITPDVILNRWIVPLSRGIDFLRPNTGNKFTVPFEVKLVISTNLEPASLGDDAFLRRLRSKIFVGACTENAFHWILSQAAERNGLEVTEDSANFMSKVTYEYLGELRPYVAIDFCEIARGVADYDQRPMRLDNDLIDRVAALYFVNDYSEDQPTDAYSGNLESTRVVGDGLGGDMAPTDTHTPAPTPWHSARV